VTASAARVIPIHRAAAQAQEFVRIKNVDKVYKARGGALKAVDDVTLDFHEGEFVSIVGPSGCGKSTLMMMVAGLVPVSAGEISIRGETVRKPYTDVGVIFQRDALLEWRTVLDNVLLQIDVRRLPRRKYEGEARALLERVGLGGRGDSFPDRLSGGEQQRVAIARAVIGRPELLVADEPTGNVDAEMANRLMGLFTAMNRLGTTVVVATHNLDLAGRLDRIVALEDGRLRPA